ncbi:MAG: SGNH/GDSL hydrolase family protein [Spirochaetota bacterium]
MKKAIFYFLFLLFNLVLAEFILSLFDKENVIVKGYDKNLLFAMYPNKTGMVVSDEYSVKVETNRLGFRQHLAEHQSYRNIVLGDSFTEGWGVREKEVYIHLLNKKLPTEKRFLNLGMHGASPILFALQLPHFLKQYKPDSVIIQLFDNDLDDNEKLQKFISNENGSLKPKKRIAASFLGETLYNFCKETTLYRLFQRVYKKVKGIPSPILYYKPGKEPQVKTLTYQQAVEKYGELKPLGNTINTKYNNQFGFYKDNDSRWKSLLSKQKKLLELLVKQANNAKVKLQFLYIPAREFFAKGGILGDIKTDDKQEFYTKNPHYLLIKDVCDRNQLECIYASDLFFANHPEKLYFPHDAHLNSLGHAVLAKGLYERMQQ